MQHLFFLIPLIISLILILLIIFFNRLFGLDSKSKKTCYFILITLLLFTISFLFEKPDITANQLFYFSSTLSQVCATLYSVTIAGYVLLEDKLNEEIKKDDTLTDIIDSLKLEYREILIYTGFLTFLCISFGVSNILIAENTNKNITNPFFSDLIFYNCLFFSLATIISVLFFVSKVTDPKKYIKASNKAIAENNEVSLNDKMELSEKHVVDFIKGYNRLEKMIIDAAQKNDIKCYEHERLTSAKCINYLRQIGKIDMQLFDELHKLRKFRNYLIHGNNLLISKSVLDKLLLLTEQFEQSI